VDKKTKTKKLPLKSICCVNEVLNDTGYLRLFGIDENGEVWEYDDDRDTWSYIGCPSLEEE
jgi:hypothetical protein